MEAKAARWLRINLVLSTGGCLRLGGWHRQAKMYGLACRVPRMQPFFSVTNELDWIKYICTKSKINIALFNTTKRLGFNCPWPEAPSSYIDWPVSEYQTSVINSFCKLPSSWGQGWWLCCGGDGGQQAVSFVPNSGDNYNTSAPHHHHRDI